jgi:signal transduction histidine kinase
MPFRRFLRCLWPLAVPLIMAALLVYARAVPNWALVATSFGAGAITVWCAARALFGQRVAELEATKHAVETERGALRDSEAQLRRSEARLAHAQRIAAMGSWELDLVGGELIWSLEMYRIWQPLPEDYSPSRDGVLRHICEADRQKVVTWLDELKAGGAPPAMEFRVPAGEGRTRILRSEGAAVRDAAGIVIQVAGTLQDVTETRRLEQERNELYAELLHSQKLEALGTLAGGVAHDLNNSLVPVISLAKIVMAKLQPGSREYASVELILEAGQRARDLVRQVLAFSRKSEAERKPLALDGFVADVLRGMQPSLPAGIAIEQELAAVPPVAADAGQLEQVLVVLLSNAAQAIGDGVGTVTVEVASDAGRLAMLRRSSATVPGVRLTVRDTGCGMDVVTRRRIFEPFFTTKEVGRGTGLGLSVVHGIVTGHGGQIAVESEPGVGTRFDIYLPCMSQSTSEVGSSSLGAAAA